jgi:NAD(P)H dehydrogenase (quinone)
MTTLAVTGATGHLGGRIIEHLLTLGVAPGDIAPLARSQAKAAPLRERGLDVRVGSYDDPAALSEALAGVDRIVLISPPSLDNAGRLRQLYDTVMAVRDIGVSQLTYVGLSDPEKRPFGLEDVELAMEHAIRAVDLPFTFVRNAVYLDELGPELTVAAATGELVSATQNRPLNWVLRDDMAAATAAVLTQDGHLGKTYELTNTTLFAYDDLAGLLSTITGRTVSHRSASTEETAQALTSGGMDPQAAQMMAGSFHTAIAADKFSSTSPDVEELTGHTPRVSTDLLRRLLG